MSSMFDRTLNTKRVYRIISKKLSHTAIIRHKANTINKRQALRGVYERLWVFELFALL